jgi:myo-inositol 2-dehydrogenase / D-chiro-inositol 1-dehydrogenase
LSLLLSHTYFFIAQYPFLEKIGNWNRNRSMTGDSLVEKCCHFFDLFRLLTGQEACLSQVRALAQRGVNYQNEYSTRLEVPIIDAAYVFMPFGKNSGEQEQHDTDADSTDSSPSSASSSSSAPKNENSDKVAVQTMACLELCMYAEGSRHQEEIIVTGTKGRLEAYLPENKVYAYQRPSLDEWSDRSVPPPKSTIREVVYDCSDVRNVHGIETDKDMPTHGGYHYSSTAVEWYQLLAAMNTFHDTGLWQPGVSFLDGLKAVEIGLKATRAIVNEQEDGCNKKK